MSSLELTLELSERTGSGSIMSGLLLTFDDGTYLTFNDGAYLDLK